MGKTIHIISFDVPYPANYGGVIDVYYKIRSLHALGWSVILHCFEYGRTTQPELGKYCTEVNYYKRKTGLLHFLSDKPYIVNTRNSEKLINRLLADNYPILFEGLHSCAFISDERFRNRVKVVRTHNIEHDYYLNLARSETRFINRLYFNLEAKKLRNFEKQLVHATAIAAISANDAYHFKRNYTHVYTIPAFHPSSEIQAEPGSGHFVLYHGNLAVAENDLAAYYLVTEVFSRIPEINFVIAGSQPSARIRQAVQGKTNIRLMADISSSEVDMLVKEAHINVLPTFQATGIKLKLLAALFNGRHCVVNTPMVANTGLESLCHIVNSPDLMAAKIKTLMTEPFTATELEKRKIILNAGFSNAKNAVELVKILGDKTAILTPVKSR